LVLLFLFFPSLVNLPGKRSLPQQKVKKVDITKKVEVYVKPIEATDKNMILWMQVALGPLFNDLKKQVGVNSKIDQVDYDIVSAKSLMMAELLARLHQWPDIGITCKQEAKVKFAKRQKGLGTLDAQSAAQAIYHSANKKDFQQARKSFLKMTKNCNLCHQEMKSSWVPVVLEP